MYRAPMTDRIQNSIDASLSPRVEHQALGSTAHVTTTLELHEVVSAFRRSLWIVLILGALGFAGTYYLLAGERMQYRAEALIRLRDVQAEVTGGLVTGRDARRFADRQVDPLLSEMTVLEGRLVAGAVADREGYRLFDFELGAPSQLVTDVRVALPAEQSQQIDLEFRATEVVAVSGTRRVTAAYGQPLVFDSVRFTVRGNPRRAALTLYVVPRENAVDWVLGRMSARPTDGTDAITVTATTPAPALSVRTVNAAIEEYQLANAARARELNRRRRTFLEARLQETGDSLVAAQTALASFRSRTGTYGVREQSLAEQSDATAAERERKQLLAEQLLRRGLLAELDRTERPTRTPAFRTLLASPDVSGNPMVSELYARLSELETKREELLAAGRPPEHAEVQQLQSVLVSVERRLIEAVRSQVGALDVRLEALGTMRAQSSAEVGRLTPTEAEEVRLSERIDAMRAIGTQLRAELQRTRLAEAVEIGQVEIVDRATRALPLGSRRPLKLGLGLAFGLFLGSAIALLRSQLRAGLRRRIDVEQLLHVPGLAVIPQLPKVTKGRRFSGIKARAGIAEANDSAAGAYRVLRTRLLFAPNTGTSIRTVVVTSAWAGEGKTTTAANLAVTLAHQGMRVLLIDCDLRRPRLHSILRMSNEAGLSDVLRGSATLAQVAQPSRIERLSLLSSGVSDPGPIGPSELLGSPAMNVLLAAAARQFEIILLDTPPVLLAPDASILAARADCALLVVRAGRTGRALAQDALHELAAVGANVIGAVLNDPDSKAERYHDYSYSYAR
jgi:tyrosine-protein kinase Etk/Wzc